MPESQSDNPEKNVKFIDKTYVLAYVIAVISALVVYSIEGKVAAAAIIIGLLGFTFSVLNDAVETSKNLFKYSSVKSLAAVFASVVTTFALIKTYQDINSVIGIDPSLLGFTSSIVFIIKLVSLSAFYVGIAFFIFMILASTFLPLLLLPLGIKKEDKKNKSHWGKFRWFSRVLSLFAVYILGSVLSPDRPLNKVIITNLVKDFALYADFNSKHHCTNSDVSGKPVIFLQKGHVLTPKGNGFEIVKCY